MPGGREAERAGCAAVVQRIDRERAAADAIELAALSHALDLRVTEALQGLIEAEPITLDDYAEAYRRAGLRRLRQHQVLLIHRVGIDLDRAVSKPA